MTEDALPDLPDDDRPGLRIVGPDDFPREPDWYPELIWKTVKGNRLMARTLENAVMILARDEAWKDAIRLDTFVGQVHVTRPPWLAHQQANGKPAAYWTDSDTARLQAWLTRVHGLDMRIADCEHAVQITAERNAYSSAQNWMESLKWDGSPRLSEWISYYLGAEMSDYCQMVSRWWLISAAARVYQPGCKADHVLVLQGAQGIGKSSALSALGGKWHSDTGFDLASKDSYLALRGKLIVELGEFVAVRRAEEDRAKAFFSSSEDHFRPPYGRRTITVPRQCVFAGTTNGEEIFRDETGNRRFWPITCGNIRLDELRADRSQIWAEAIAAYKAGEHWYPRASREVEACSTEQQQRMTSTDAWQDVIARWLKDPLCHYDEDGGITIGKVLEYAIKKPVGQWTRGDEMRAGAAMRGLGWKRDRHRDEMGHVRRRYMPPKAP